MNRLITIASLIIMLPLSLLGKQSVSKPHSLEQSNVSIAIKLVSDVQQLGNELSVRINKIESGKLFKTSYDSVVLSKVREIRGKIDSIKALAIGSKLGAQQNAYKAEFEYFNSQFVRADTVLSKAKSYKSETLYRAQIDYLEARVESFLAATRNFKHYLLSLDDLMAKIEKRFKITDTLIGKVQNTSDTILTILKGDRAIYKQYAVISGYSNIIGVAYLHNIGKSNNVKEGNYIGVELVVPVDKRTAKDAGGFVLYGLRSDKLLLQAGVGYLQSIQSQENVSWKAALLYSPHSFGLGASYSPLTKAGIQLSYRL